MAKNRRLVAAEQREDIGAAAVEGGRGKVSVHSRKLAHRCVWDHRPLGDKVEG